MNSCLRCGHDSNIGLRLDEETLARCLPARAPDEVGSAGRVETETSARFSAWKEAPGFGRGSMEAWHDSETVPSGAQGSDRLEAPGWEAQESCGQHGVGNGVVRQRSLVWSKASRSTGGSPNG